MSASYAADLELARRCAAGDEQAWERFVLEYRPLLYRAADALDPGGGARDLADSLYADLYSKSLFRYYQGRSSLATWLRAVLSQRYVDRVRARKRTEPLADEDDGPALRQGGRAGDPPDPDRLRNVARLREALAGAIDRLAPRDRLRLGCYYVQELTLAETGRLLKEHEATVSRQLARTRRDLRGDVERHLREGGLSDVQIAECVESASDDPGPLDLRQMLGDEPEEPEVPGAPRKQPARDRSI